MFWWRKKKTDLQKMVDDVIAMNAAMIENVTLHRATVKILFDWCCLKGHDKCWHHTEILESLCKLYNLQCIPSELPLESEFEAECNKYRRKLYSVEDGCNQKAQSSS